MVVFHTLFREIRRIKMVLNACNNVSDIVHITFSDQKIELSVSSTEQFLLSTTIIPCEQPLNQNQAFRFCVNVQNILAAIQDAYDGNWGAEFDLGHCLSIRPKYQCSNTNCVQIAEQPYFNQTFYTITPTSVTSRYSNYPIVCIKVKEFQRIINVCLIYAGIRHSGELFVRVHRNNIPQYDTVELRVENADIGNLGKVTLHTSNVDSGGGSDVCEVCVLLTGLKRVQGFIELCCTNIYISVTPKGCIFFDDTKLITFFMSATNLKELKTFY